jgi:hypothetical protein
MQGIREDVGGLRDFASPQYGRLGLGRGGPVGCAGSLSFAAVLACMLCVAAALPLAIVLALAGVLGGSGRLVLRDQEYTGLGRSTVLSSGLCVEANGRTAKNTGKCGGEGEVMCGVDFHGSTFQGWAARFARRDDVVGSEGTECPWIHSLLESVLLVPNVRPIRAAKDTSFLFG